MRCVIVIENGLKSAQAFEFDREQITIGRLMGNDILINDRSVSGNHAKISFHEGQAELIDLESKNGTRLNNEPVKRASLHDQDRFSIGNICIQFVCPEALSEHAMDQTMIAGAHRWNAEKLEQLLHSSAEQMRNIVQNRCKRVHEKFG
ncbi:MAG: FHA domain-containing protein [Nitrospiraceae bacterium]|nr:MAG: FHA domain-containing protein [Nitrospiraceae bacterium]